MNRNDELKGDPAPDPVKVEEIDEADEEAAFAEEPEAAEPGLPEAVSEIPEWATVPAGVKMPPPGCSVAFIRIRASWTTNPAKGDRWCMVTAIGETEEKLAYARARGEQMRSVQELAKACIKVVDGHKASWDPVAKRGSVSEFWSSIGAKGRQMVRNYYVRTHTVSEGEILDFFAKDFVNVTVG